MNQEVLFRLAEEAIKLWDVEVESINLHLQSENTVYKVEALDGSTYALRIHRKDYHDLDELNSEHLWTKSLSNAGLLVPEAVVTKNGDTYASVSFLNSDEYRYVGLVKWIEGTILNDLILDLEDKGVSDLYESLGKVVAKFHKATIAWEQPKGFKRHSFDVDGFLGDQPFWGRFWEAQNATISEREKLALIRKNMIETMSEFSKNINFFGMIHADLHSQNVLIQGKSLSVIDFDDAGFGWYGFDLAVAIWDRLDFTATGCHFDIAYQSLKKGYLGERPDTGDILETIPIFLLMRTLMIIRWIEDRPEAGYEAFIPVLINAAFDQAKELKLLN